MVAEGIPMLKFSMQEIGNGFKTTVRMIRKALGFTRLQFHGTHMVEQQEGIEFGDLVVWKYAVNQDAFAVGNERSRRHILNASINCHNVLLDVRQTQTIRCEAISQ
jgi:hypothetical protein